MSLYGRACERYEETQPIPGRKGILSSKSLSNPGILPGLLSGQKRGKTKGKIRFDRPDLRTFGPLKAGSLMNLVYYEHAVSAGYPTSMEDPFIRHLDIGRYLTRYPKTTYYYKASDYSMVNAGIHHGDLLVVDTALKPKHRDIVIALLNGEFTLKRYFLDNQDVKLLSANPDYDPITVTREMTFFIQGVVTTVIRTFNPLPYDNQFKEINYAQLRRREEEE